MLGEGRKAEGNKETSWVRPPSHQLPLPPELAMWRQGYMCQPSLLSFASLGRTFLALILPGSSQISRPSYSDGISSPGSVASLSHLSPPYPILLTPRSGN